MISRVFPVPLRPFRQILIGLPLGLFILRPGVAQAGRDGKQALGILEQNFPNPFERRTAISFEILPEACVDGKPALVTIQILNVLVQAVGSPTLRDSTGARRIQDLRLRCRRYLSFWDRRVSGGGKRAAPGSYFYRLFVNGRSQAVRLMQVREQVRRPGIRAGGDPP